MAYTASFSVNVGDPTKASDVTTLAANDDFLKAAVDAIMADSATPSSTLKAAVVLADGVTATTQSAGNDTTRVATTAFVKTAVDASSTDPAGSNTQIQYNNSGAFGASANLTFDGTNLTVAGELDAATLDISGNADIDGTLETDALTIGGTTLLANDTNNRVTTATGSGTLNGEANLTFDGSTLQVTGALTVGVDGTGHDVQFFGDSAGHYMLWDQSADEMILRMSSADAYAANTETGNLKLVNAGTDTDNQSVGIAFDVGAGNVGAIGKARIDAVHNGTGANADLVFATQASGTVTQRMRISNAGLVYLGDANAAGNYGNANMTQGLTINMAANDNECLALKSSGDVAHGLVSVAETDTFFEIAKRSGTDGGTILTSICENTTTAWNFGFNGYGGTASTTPRNTGSTGLMHFFVASHNGSNSLSNLPANSVAHSFHGQVGGTTRTLFLIDEDGDWQYDGADGGVLDDYADAELVRAFDHILKPDKLVRSKWDEDVRYNRQDLVDAKIIGEPGPNGETPLVNGAQLQRLHHGAIWQNHVAVQELSEVYENRIAALEQRLLLLEA